MELEAITGRAKEQLAKLINLEVSGVTGVSKQDDGWHVTLELIERKAIPDTQDLLGVYVAVLDDKGNMVTYQRKRVRRRMDIEEEAAE